MTFSCAHLQNVLLEFLGDAASDVQLRAFAKCAFGVFWGMRRVTFSRAHSQKRAFGTLRCFAATFADTAEGSVYLRGAHSEKVSM